MLELDKLVAEAKNGNKLALNEILERFKPFIIKCCKSIFISGYETEDLIQIGYLTLINTVKKYDPNKNNNFTAYAIKAIKNNYYYEIRQKSRHNLVDSLNKELEEGIELLSNIPSGENIEELIVQKEVSSDLAKIINKLPNEDIELIYEVFLKGIKIKDYAASINTSYGSCIKRKNRLLEKIKKMIISDTKSNL